MLLDEPIAVREEDAEVGVGVVPADDLQIGELRVHLGVDLRPGLMREGHLREPGGGPLAADRLDHLHERPDVVAVPRPDQNAADLNRGVLARVLPQRGVDLRGEIHAKRLVPAARKDSVRKILARQEPDIGFIHHRRSRA